MIELISLQLLPWISISSSPVTVQTQDPSVMLAIQILAVFVGGVIALIANYFLQMHSFNVQRKAKQEDRRTEAYVELLSDISDYGMTHGINNLMPFHMAKAAMYGSPKIRDKIRPEIMKPFFGRERSFDTTLNEIKQIILEEI